jgi:hypothetical protein
MDPTCHSIAVVTCHTLLYSVTVIDACVLTWMANGIVVSGRRPLIKGYAALHLIVGAGHDPFGLMLPATTVVHCLTGPALFEWEDRFFPEWHCHRHRPSPIAVTKSRPVLSGITVRANERIAPAPPGRECARPAPRRTTSGAIIDACCDAWNALMAKSEVIASTGTRDWAQVKT